MSQPDDYLSAIRARADWLCNLRMLSEETEVVPQSLSYVRPNEYRAHAELFVDDLLARVAALEAEAKLATAPVATAQGECVECGDELKWHENVGAWWCPRCATPAALKESYQAATQRAEAAERERDVANEYLVDMSNELVIVRRSLIAAEDRAATADRAAGRMREALGGCITSLAMFKAFICRTGRPQDWTREDEDALVTARAALAPDAAPPRGGKEGVRTTTKRSVS